MHFEYVHRYNIITLPEEFGEYSLMGSTINEHISVMKAYGLVKFGFKHEGYDYTLALETYMPNSKVPVMSLYVEDPDSKVKIYLDVDEFFNFITPPANPIKIKMVDIQTRGLISAEEAINLDFEFKDLDGNVYYISDFIRNPTFKIITIKENKLGNRIINYTNVTISFNHEYLLQIKCLHMFKNNVVGNVSDESFLELFTPQTPMKSARNI